MDDIMRASDLGLEVIAKKTNARFEVEKEKALPCTLTRFKVERDDHGTITLHQYAYLRKTLFITGRCWAPKIFVNADETILYFTTPTRLPI